MSEQKLDLNYENFEELIARLLSVYAGPEFAEELTMAKKEFFNNTAVLDPNNDNYQLRLFQFYDWYLFTRPLSGYKQTPLEVCHLSRDLRLDDHDKKMIEMMKRHRHSMFEFIKTKDSDCFIKDLIKDEKIVVKNCPWIFGFEQEELFEARLVEVSDGKYIFTRGFCFHPSTVKKFILDEMKTLKSNIELDPNETLLKLLRMRYRLEQYKHVRPEMIYQK